MDVSTRAYQWLKLSIPVASLNEDSLPGHDPARRTILRRHSGVPELRQADGPPVVFAAAGPMGHRHLRYRGIDQGDRARPGTRRSTWPGPRSSRRSPMRWTAAAFRSFLAATAQVLRCRPGYGAGAGSHGRDRGVGEGRSRPFDARRAGAGRSHSRRRASTSASPVSDPRRICPMRCSPAEALVGRRPP